MEQVLPFSFIGLYGLMKISLPPLEFFTLAKPSFYSRLSFSIITLARQPDKCYKEDILYI
jgi:hypothetical protein